MENIITSINNPLVKVVHSLRRKRNRENNGLFLVEGIVHVGEAFEAGWEIETLIHSPELLSSDFGRNLVKRQADQGVRIVATTKQVFLAIAEKENPIGIMAVVKRRSLPVDLIDAGKCNLAVALISPQDPGNVGTILRTLDAINGDMLFMLDGGVDPYHPTVVRSSMGAIFWKPIVEAASEDFYEWAGKNKITVVGSSAHADTHYEKIRDIHLPVILLLGSEQKGLTDGQLAACDVKVTIPMNGRCSSLNVAVAAGIMLYAIISGIRKNGQ